MNTAILGFIGTIIGAILVTASSVITTLTNTGNSTKNQTILEKYKWEEFSREFQRNNYLNFNTFFLKLIVL